MNGSYLFDTNSVVYYLKGLASWVQFIDSTPMVKRCASVITRMELLSYPGIKPDEEKQVHQFLSDLEIIPMNGVIESAAIAIRRTMRLKLPDAIIAATAVEVGATVITGDERLLELAWPGFKTVRST